MSATDFYRAAIEQLFDEQLAAFRGLLLDRLIESVDEETMRRAVVAALDTVLEDVT
jgi:hypothetical protein